jgi:integrase
MRSSEKAEKKPDFAKVPNVENLYFRISTGTYYTRAKIGEKRTFENLGTSDRDAALILHREKQSALERQRQAGVPLQTDFRHLGALAREYRQRVETSDLADASRKSYLGNLDRLIDNWASGSFETFPIRKVDTTVIFELRHFLKSQAVVPHGRAGICAEEFKTIGYSNIVVNDTLLCLRRLCRIAIEKRILVEDPFTKTGVLREKISLPRKTKAPAMPDAAMFDRILVEIRRATKAVGVFSNRPGWVKRHLELGNAAGDFAEFLAYSGARCEEANLVLVGHYKIAADQKTWTLHIPGYKTDTSNRTIPVLPRLKRLLDRLTAGRQPEEKLLAGNSCLKQLAAACEALKVEKLTQHDLRHFFATICLLKGVRPKTLSEWLGHADGGVLVMQTYGHLLPAAGAAEAALVNFDEVTAGEVLPFRPPAGVSAVRSTAG